MATTKRNAMVFMAVAMAVCLAFGMALAAPVPAQAANKGKLIKTMKVYYKSGKKWKTFFTHTFSYNSKKDPVKIKKKYQGGTTIETMKYVYKSGKKKSMTSYLKYQSDPKEPAAQYTFDKKGRVATEQYYLYDGSLGALSKISYNKKGFIKKIKNSDSDVTFKYTYYSNGKVRTMKTRSFGTQNTVAKFNKKGFLRTFKSFRVAEPYTDCTYKYDKNGLVKSLVLDFNENGTHYYQKYVFKYNSKKIPMARYRSMVNSILTHQGDGCGTYWY